MGITSSVSQTGAGYARGTLRGAQFYTDNASTATGTFTNFMGGYFTTSQTSTTMLPTSNLIGLRNDLTIPGRTNIGFNGFFNYVGVTSTAGNNIPASYGIYNLLTNDTASTVNYSGALTALYSYNNFKGASTANALYGAEIRNYNLSTKVGTTATQAGAYIYNLLQGSNAVTDAYGLYVLENVSSGNVGNIANSYGIFVDTSKSAASASVVTNQYGLYLTSVVNATNNWAIYSAGGNSYHNGRIGVGNIAVANPTAQVHLAPTQTTEGLRIDKISGIGGQPQLLLNENRPATATAQRAIQLLNGTTPNVEIGALHDPAGMDYFYIATHQTDLGTSSYNSSNLVYLVDPATNNTTIGGNIPAPGCKLVINGYIKVGTSDVTGDATPAPGMIKYNSATGKYQGYVGAPTNAWQDLN